MNVLVIGTGGAGISAVQAIRSVDDKIDISLVSKENCLPYSLCGLPDFLSGEISMETLTRLDDDFFIKNNINLIFGKEAVKVDPSRKIVHFKNNSKSNVKETLEFDKLLIATGSKPIIPSIPGLNKKQVYIVSNLASCKNIIKGLKKAEKIAIIGGGFVGIECAQALKDRGKQVFVVDILDRILANMFDDEISSIAQEILERLGINFFLGKHVKEIIGNDVVEGLKLKDSKIDFDMVLLTVGFKPNIDIVRDSMIKANQGIIVNEFMESNVKDIHAAGDVAESFDCIYGKSGLKATWSNAVEQGHVAGLNIAGKRCRYPGFSSYNIIHINDVPFLSMGNVTNLPNNCLKLVSKGINSMRKVFIQNDKILGMEFFGDMANSGYLFSLLNKRSDVKEYTDKILSNFFQYRWDRNERLKSMIK
jgi:NAD(P)H-nitrite reductase large subunit